MFEMARPSFPSSPPRRFPTRPRSMGARPAGAPEARAPGSLHAVPWAAGRDRRRPQAASPALPEAAGPEPRASSIHLLALSSLLTPPEERGCGCGCGCGRASCAPVVWLLRAAHMLNRLTCLG